MKLLNFFYFDWILFGAFWGEYLQKDLDGVDLVPVMLTAVWGNMSVNNC